MEDFQAVLDGPWHRVVAPEENLIGGIYQELQHFFPDRMFTSFGAFL